MTRSRLFVLSSLLIVAAGLALALGAVVLNPARAAVGPLPGEALVLPAETSFVVGFDVKRLTASPFYQRYARANASMRPQAFGELQEKTGIDPERDLDLVVIAGSKGSSPSSGERSGIVFVTGTFDRARLARAIESEKRGVTWKQAHGSTVYLFNEGSKGAGAFSFLDDRTLVIGDQKGVEDTVSGHAEGRTALRSNAELMALLQQVKPGSTFWMVGDQSLLANMPKSIPAPGMGGSQDGTTSLSLPALKSLTVTGDLDPAVAVEVTGAARDEAAAKQLADVVRGFAA